MSQLSNDLKRRIVDAYLSGRSGNYVQTAEMFGVGEATVSRLLRRYRETGDVQNKPKGGNNPRKVDLDWLRAHADAFPDATLEERVQELGGPQRGLGPHLDDGQLDAGHRMDA